MLLLPLLLLLLLLPLRLWQYLPCRYITDSHRLSLCLERASSISNRSL